MAETASIGLSCTGVGSIVSKTVDVTGEDNSILNFSIANSTTDELHTIAVDVSVCRLVLITTDGALLIETNSNSAPDDTFTFPSGGGELYWTNRFPTEVTCPLTVDVTKLYFTNTSGAAVAVQIKILTAA